MLARLSFETSADAHVSLILSQQEGKDHVPGLGCCWQEECVPIRILRLPLLEVCWLPLESGWDKVVHLPCVVCPWRPEQAHGIDSLYW